jgi:hypothetical protein
MLGITLQQFLLFQKADNSPGDCLRQEYDVLTRWCPDPARSCPVGAIHLNSIEKQHVEMYVQIQLTTEGLDECDNTGMCHFMGPPDFFDQVCGDNTVDSTQHLPPCGRAAGKQDAQRLRQSNGCMRTALSAPLRWPGA